MAPLPEVVKRTDGLYRAGGEGGESSVAADGWFTVTALVVGVAVALVVYLRTRPGRVGPLVGLAAGGLAGSLLAWWVGRLLGPGSLASTAAGLPTGARFDGPLTVSALGVLLAWPMGAVITYFAVAAGAETSVARDEEVGPPEEARWPTSVSPADPAERSEPR